MLVKTKNLYKIYATGDIETHSLADINLEIAQGEFVAVMGPSGCGKSTLLNLLGLLDNPSRGQLEFLGIDVSQFAENQRAEMRKANIGFIFQSFNLIDELTVYENIELPLIYMRMPKAERKNRVEEVMANLEIAHRRGHFPQQLSGGQQQRVAVSRAIVAKPNLILADEPTGNLDSKNGEEVMRLITDLHSDGTTVIMVTHSSQHSAYAQRVIHLFDGQVAAEVK